MADTIREQIIAGYMTRLAFWTIANGFNFDCGRSAKRAVLYIEDTSLPTCVLWPQPEDIEGRYGRNLCTMIIKIEALAEIGTINRSVVQDQLLGDVIQLMTDPLIVVSNLTEDAAYIRGGSANVQKNEEKITAVFAEFKVTYETELGNPYSQ